MNKILLLLIIVFTGFSHHISAQNESFSLSLDEVIKLGNQKSLDAFRYKNTYLSSYWEFRYYKADKLPSLSLNATPLNFTHAQESRYNEKDSIYNYFLNNIASSDVGMRLNQKVGMTGGNLFVNSRLGFQKNLSGKKTTGYVATPVSIGYSQTLDGFNALRWESKIEPLKYEKAKKGFIQSQETLAMKSAAMFFDLVEAQIQLKIALNSLANADTLYKIGKGRFQVGTVTQDELLNLELNQLNATQALSAAKLEVERSQSGLNSYLMLNKKTRINCLVPSVIPGLQINVDEALTLALNNNPEILNQQQQMLEQDREVDRAHAETGLNTEIYGEFGINEARPDIDELAINHDNTQRVIIGLNIPILDWGRRKGKIMMAESTREVANARIKQARIDFEQNVIQSVMEFNLQAEQVRNAAKADTVSQKAYEVTFQRFLIGKVDVIKLNLARNDLESAKKAYINAVKTYWNYYYRLRMLTLYDFMKGETLSAEYDKIIEK